MVRYLMMKSDWRVAAYGLALIAVLGFAIFLDAAPAHAQTEYSSHTTDTDETPPADARDNHPNPDGTLGFSRSPSMPPLPFRAPLVGPVIKETSWDWSSVDKWTTAFLPDPAKVKLDFEMPDEDKWIYVNLSEQTVVAFERGKPIRAFVISSGLPRTPTVTGEFRIRMKVRKQRMAGGDPELGNDYDLDNVQWVQYFYEDYGFHGTYWHKNFGRPMSHGCVNMTNADAQWLFNWAGPTWDGHSAWQRMTEGDPGTLVIIQD
jgi:hypothetical protein